MKKKITVGVRVNGALKLAKIQLFSEPDTLAQADILSLLVLGRTLEQATRDESQILLSALSALNLSGTATKQIGKQLQHGLGLDEITVQSATEFDPSTQKPTEHTSLLLGKALSPRLYVSYSIGLINAENTLRVRYKINDKWTLQTDTNGDTSGVDLLYTIEKG